MLNLLFRQFKNFFIYKGMKSRINSNIKPPDSFTVSKDIPTYCQWRIDSRPPSTTPQR